MSDDFDESRPDEGTKRVPPLLLLGGFLVAATAGSAFFVLPNETSSTTVSSTITIPLGGSVVGLPDDPGESLSEKSVKTPEPKETPVEPVDPETARLSKLIVGSWRQDYYGERTLTVKADGTATMTILPSGVFAFGFGPKIDLTMFWSVKDGHLDYGVNGGTPDDKVKLAAKTWGDHWVEKIISLDESKLDLLSVDGSSHSIWERVPSDELSEAEGPTP
ncbi:MAG: hypothetical protein ACI8P0_002343 [Planctomycetaceae bacterium]|jgi:hypothetical protein